MGKGPKGRAHHDNHGMLMGTSLRSFAHPTNSERDQERHGIHGTRRVDL